MSVVLVGSQTCSQCYGLCQGFPSSPILIVAYRTWCARLRIPRITVLLFAEDLVLLASSDFGLKHVLRDRGRLLPSALLSQSKMEHEVNSWFGVASAIVQELHCCGVEGAELEGTSLNCPVSLRFNPYLWAKALGSARKHLILYTCIQK